MVTKSGGESREIKEDIELLSELIERVESREFASKFGVCSGLGLFLTALASDDVVKEIVEIVRRVPEARETILSRAWDLVDQCVDEGDGSYETRDVGLAALVFAALAVDKKFGEEVASVAKRARNVWWARRLVEDVLGKAKVSLSAFGVLLDYRDETGCSMTELASFVCDFVDQHDLTGELREYLDCSGMDDESESREK